MAGARLAEPRLRAVRQSTEESSDHEGSKQRQSRPGARANRDELISLSPRALLTATEIVDLDAALMAAYRMHAELRAAIPAARFIARPPIPAALSESLVGYSARWLFGAACAATFGGTRADLIVSCPFDDQLLVEVKATGSGEFQEVKPRDLAADALVWVAFGSRYLDAQGPTDIFVLRDPSRFKPPTTRSGTVKRKFGLKAFLAAASILSGFTAWRFENLDSLAAGGQPSCTLTT